MQKSIIYNNGTSSIDLVNDLQCRLIDIQGVSPYSTINAASIAGFDGSTYVSDQVEKRSITMIIVFLDTGDCEAVIHRLYDVFRIKNEGVLQYISENRDLKIKCRVLSADCPHNVMPLKMQIQLECDDPYFYADEIVSYITTTVGAFEFPFECGHYEIIVDGTFQYGVSYWETSGLKCSILPDKLTLGKNGSARQSLSLDRLVPERKLYVNISATGIFECMLQGEADGYGIVINPNVSNSGVYGFSLPDDIGSWDKCSLVISNRAYANCTLTYISAYIEGNIEFGIITDSLTADVNNEGEIPTGCLFALTATGVCLNPKIQDVNTFEWIQINVAMGVGDQLIIDTRRGQKAITFVHGGVSENYINHKVYGSTFLQLAIGTNTFVYSADENESNLEISCIFTEKYGGV